MINSIRTMFPICFFRNLTGVSESQIMDDAKTFDSWEEFDFYTAMLDPEDTTTPRTNSGTGRYGKRPTRSIRKSPRNQEPQTVKNWKPLKRMNISVPR